MPTPNEQLADDFINRSVDVFAMTETEARRFAQEFSDEDQRTLAELIILFQDEDDEARVLRQLDRVLAQRRDALERMKDRMYRTIQSFTEDEGEFVSATVGAAQDETDNRVFAAAFIAVLINRVMKKSVSGWDNATFDDLFKELVERDAERIAQTFSRTYSVGRGARWMTQALRKDFATNAETAYLVLHTMVQHARSITLDLAMTVVGGSVRWVSVLDGKTTAVCRSRSGKIYPADSGPRPPAHVRCRSIVVPHLPGGGEYTEPTYSEWLQRQSPDRVREILGKAKGDMFLAGTLSLEDMVTAKGRELTLKELQTSTEKRR